MRSYRRRPTSAACPLSQECPGPRAAQEPAHGLDPWVDDDCLQELRWSYDRRDLAQARADLAAWIGKWQAKYPQLVAWGMNREPSHCARSARRSPSWSEPAADRELHWPAIFALHFRATIRCFIYDSLAARMSAGRPALRAACSTATRSLSTGSGACRIDSHWSLPALLRVPMLVVRHQLVYDLAKSGRK